MKFSILPSAVAPVTKEPQRSIGYLDTDGDLFLYVGTSTDHNYGIEAAVGPWLEIGKLATRRRSPDYPAQPLTELSAEQLEDAIDSKLAGY